MKVDAPGAHFAKHVDNFDGGDDGANKISKGIAAAVSHGPKAERKLMLGFRIVKTIALHELSPWLRLVAITN
jgi:hypothetical protein